jgi:hypothetical protein
MILSLIRRSSSVTQSRAWVRRVNPRCCCDNLTRRGQLATRQRLHHMTAVLIQVDGEAQQLCRWSTTTAHATGATGPRMISRWTWTGPSDVGSQRSGAGHPLKQVLASFRFRQVRCSLLLFPCGQRRECIPIPGIPVHSTYRCYYQAVQTPQYYVLRNWISLGYLTVVQLAI